jgi:hypothetical protein
MKNAIKALFVMLLSAISLSAYAQSTTNSIYIDQVGDASTINLTQKGQNNKIGTEQNRFQIGGDAQLINVTQQGNNNQMNGKIVQADNIDYGVTVTGDTNAITFNHGDSASVAGSKLVLGINGSSNTVELNQGDTSSSTNADQEITIGGDQNAYTSTINADDVKNRMTISGDQNALTMTQNGHSGKEVTSVVTGNGNTLTINQTSTLNVDKIDVTHTGSGNNIAINQCNAGGTC